MQCIGPKSVDLNKTAPLEINIATLVNWQYYAFALIYISRFREWALGGPLFLFGERQIFCLGKGKFAFRLILPPEFEHLN